MCSRNTCPSRWRGLPASNAESVEQTSKTLEDIPTSNDVRYRLNKLENLEGLEEQLNEALRSRTPGRLQNSHQKLAIDLNLIPLLLIPSKKYAKVGPKNSSETFFSFLITVLMNNGTVASSTNIL